MTKKIYLSETIIKYLKNNKGWCFSGDIEKLAQGRGHYASVGARTARRLAQEGRIRNKYNEKGMVMYHSK
jgi:hypothetical protein